MKRSTKRIISAIILAVILILVYQNYPEFFPQTEVAVITPSPTPAVLSVTNAPEIGKQIKTTGCISNGILPDPACTPGAIDPKVSAQTVNGTICIVGYSSKVRPPVSVTEKIKVAQFAAYGINGPMSDYELDHLISLELGGSPDSVANLWPEPYNIKMGAHEKDKVENYLHKEVCSGAMSLTEAQKEISTDWAAVYYRVYGQP